MSEKKTKGDLFMESYFRVFSAYDVKAERFGPLFEATNDQVAAREFMLLLRNIEPEFRGEYKLFFIGTFDFVSGEMKQDIKPQEIAVNYMKNKE